MICDVTREGGPVIPVNKWRSAGDIDAHGEVFCVDAAMSLFIVLPD